MKMNVRMHLQHNVYIFFLFSSRYYCMNMIVFKRNVIKCVCLVSSVLDTFYYTPEEFF